MNTPERSLCLLLVEDSEINQKVMCALLEKAGITPRVACNGQEAIAALSQDFFDMVLMDLQMPVMDGLEATRRIRAPDSIVFNPQIPIIAMTAHDQGSHWQECLAAGMNDYVTKPVKPDALLRVLNQWGSGEAVASPPPTCQSDALESETASIESSAPDSDTLFDSTLLLEWMENDRALACSLARDFMNDITSQLEEMEQAIKSEDIQEMKQYAHTIKGMSANMACGRLRHLAAMFENSAAHSDTETLRAHYHELRKVFGKTFAHVIAFINEKSE